MILQWNCIKNTEALIEFNCKNLWVLKPRFDPLKKNPVFYFLFSQFKPYATFASMVTLNHDLEEEKKKNRPRVPNPRFGQREEQLCSKNFPDF